MELPVTIKKHWIGYVWIGLIGLFVSAIIWFGIFSLGFSGDLDEATFWILVAVDILVLTFTVMFLYIYSLSYIELTEDRLKAENWTTLFSQTDVDTEWVRVQDVTVETGSIFALMFNYGTLTIQTAGTAQQLKMTMVPNVEYWQSVIATLADEATDVQVVQLSTSAP